MEDAWLSTRTSYPITLRTLPRTYEETDPHHHQFNLCMYLIHYFNDYFYKILTIINYGATYNRYPDDTEEKQKPHDHKVPAPPNTYGQFSTTDKPQTKSSTYSTLTTKLIPWYQTISNNYIKKSTTQSWHYSTTSTTTQKPTTQYNYFYTTHSTTRKPSTARYTQPSTSQHLQTSTIKPSPLYTYSTTPKTYSSFSNPQTQKPYYYWTTTRQTTRVTTNLFSSTTPNSIIVSTKNPYVGNYYEFKKRTTLNPYDFRNFGAFALRNENVSNNIAKRSYNSANIFTESNNKQNTTSIKNPWIKTVRLMETDSIIILSSDGTFVMTTCME